MRDFLDRLCYALPPEAWLAIIWLTVISLIVSSGYIVTTHTQYENTVTICKQYSEMTGKKTHMLGKECMVQNPKTLEWSVWSVSSFTK